MVSTADFEDLKKENERLRKLAYEDELTGVLNRRGVVATFTPIFKEAKYVLGHSEIRRRTRIEELSVIYIDIDNFKSVNDTYGHTGGDTVLRAVARLLREHVRSLDGVARLGGEEFAVIMVGAKENESCKKGEELRGRIEKLSIPECEGASVTASIGVASTASTKAETLEDLFDAADKAMYEAKHNRGKNCTVCYGELSNQKG